MENNTKVVLALLAGAAAGMALGVLLAPEKGSESRRKMGETAKKLADTVLAKAEEVIDELNKTVKT